ncbi:UDP-glucuronic acid decarboxylase family protein [Rhizobium sp. FY34]|uniref:UDP-glucuronic acid decarboxylase family protein n=1 Tax=Rhizobium sp. FY34 TaxID=2562309 RepID=UPI0010C03EE2|nr:UDP-glucuronic acid decarboxylase family protein [Rhizobium sp. FY34]
MAKRILVTGGAGFIGSNLVARLVDEGNHIICLDNFSTGPRSNVSHLVDTGRFELVDRDVRDPFFFEVDAIYNLACPASPSHYQADPIGTMMTNILGARNVLDLSKSAQIPIVQASTSEVYGDPLQHPQCEENWGHVNPIGVRACYDEGKRSAETLFFDYQRKHNVQIKVVRIFNTYGPKMQAADGRVISNFIVQALRNADITIYGNGEQTRSFCYIDDLVEALTRTMATGPEVTGPINLGNPDEITVLGLAELIREMVNSRSKIVHLPLPHDDPRKRRPEITKARTLLDWKPRTKLSEGINLTIEHFSHILSDERVARNVIDQRPCLQGVSFPSGRLGRQSDRPE